MPGVDSNEETSDYVGEIHYLNCTPVSKPYTLNITYRDSLQSITVTTRKSRALMNLTNPINILTFEGDCDCWDPVGLTTECDCASGLQWNASVLAWFHDTQILGLVDAVASILSGGYQANVTSTNQSNPLAYNVTIEEEGANATLNVIPQQYKETSARATGGITPSFLYKALLFNDE